MISSAGVNLPADVSAFKIKRIQPFCSLDTNTNEYIQKVVTKDTWESNRDSEREENSKSLLQAVYKDYCDPKGLKRFLKILIWRKQILQIFIMTYHLHNITVAVMKLWYNTLMY